MALEHSPGSKPPLDRLLQLLGWEHIPDPEKKLKNKVKVKFFLVRTMIDNGADPLQVGVKKKQTHNMATTWVAWVRRAFESLPEGQGTLDDVCAALQADPKITPLLDMRPYEYSRAVPKWRYSVSNGMKKLSGLTKSSERRGGRCVFRYNSQDAVVTASTSGKGRASKRGQPAGLPFMGKKSKNAN